MKAKAISIREPYASAIACGLKKIETRPRYTSYRGPIYIHAPLKDLPNAEIEKLVRDQGAEFHHGEIIAEAVLVDCIKMNNNFIKAVREYDPVEFSAGFYSPGRYALMLANVRRLDKPIPCKGQLGIFNVKIDEGSATK